MSSIVWRSHSVAIRVIACAVAISTPAHAADFYAGKTIEFIVGADSGGGYDIYARLIARHLGRHILGNPATVVKNMPGASSGRAAAFIYSVAPKNGTAIGALFPGAIIGPLLEERSEILFDPTKFTHLATADTGVRVCATYHTSKIKTYDDTLKYKTIMGASATGASTRDYVQFKKKTTKAQFEIVMGYKGTADITLAMERGEVDGLCGWDFSSVKSQKPDWLRDGKLNILVQVGLEPDPELTKMGVPRIWNYIAEERDRKAVELIVSQQMFQRPYVAAPGTPPQQVAILRNAFMSAMRDPLFLADAEKSRIDVAPASGEKIQALVEQLYATPKDIVARARELIKP
jgi:tripartite-type tricarboxylate transporter receptor subunit TctC